MAKKAVKKKVVKKISKKGAARKRVSILMQTESKKWRRLVRKDNVEKMQAKGYKIIDDKDMIDLVLMEK